MPHTFHIGDTIYHERRYWKMEDLRADEEIGWNANYQPYIITRITDKTIFAEGREPGGKLVGVQLSRQQREPKPRQERPTVLEIDGKQYHTRFHEYFYAEIPAKKPRQSFASPLSAAASLLNLSAPYTTDDVKRAYKRLARSSHPDAGGSHELFIELKKAKDEALKGVGLSVVTQSGKWQCSCGARIDLSVFSNIATNASERMANVLLASHRMQGHRLSKIA